jgi:hypothetical protein
MGADGGMEGVLGGVIRFMGPGDWIGTEVDDCMPLGDNS